MKYIRGKLNYRPTKSGTNEIALRGRFDWLTIAERVGQVADVARDVIEHSAGAAPPVPNVTLGPVGGRRVRTVQKRLFRTVFGIT